jgi:hypothetical protein
MNHAYNLTVEQEFGRGMSFSLAYVGTAGRDLINWRDLNACPASATETCDTSRQPFGATFPQYDHILQMNNDGYSNYNSLQTTFKVRNIHGITGQFNYVWSKSLDTGSANRGGDFLSQYQNPYNVSKNYSLSNFDTPWNVNFTLVYDIPKVSALPKFIGEGWQLNSIFRAQKGRPFTAYVRGDPTHQGVRTTYVDYDGSPLNYDFHNPEEFFNTAAFSRPTDGTVGNFGRNGLRQPGISQLDMSIFKNFKLTERLTLKFKWEVFNVLNHAMFAYATGNITNSAFGTLNTTPDVGIGLNPILGTGAQRNMQFGLAVAF